MQPPVSKCFKPAAFFQAFSKRYFCYTFTPPLTPISLLPEN
jgi:hypothetical protein